jgi:putative Mg2+ transporter-C (MgtC) family protein
VFDIGITFNPADLKIAGHLCGALVAGGIIGLERSFHGRPAGFRTHSLVCLASAVLMMLTIFVPQWMGVGAMDSRVDPTRMAQGIMTGIGFLGAGVIYKESITVRGLTTAASIWITAAIGILMGAGLFFPAIFATVLTIGVLALFPKIERDLPKHSFVHYHVTFDRDNKMTEDELRNDARTYSFNVANLSYHVLEGNLFEYRMILRTHDMKNTSRFADHLSADPRVKRFDVLPTGD